MKTISLGEGVFLLDQGETQINPPVPDGVVDSPDAASSVPVMLKTAQSIASGTPTIPVTAPVATTGVTGGSVVPTSPGQAPLPAPPPRRFRIGKVASKVGILGLLLILFTGGVVGVVAAYGHALTTNHTSSAANITANYTAATIPLSDLAKLGDVSVDNTGSLSINGLLRVNSSEIFSPTTQPTSAQPGQLYYDSSTNTLRYYNGQAYVDVLGANQKTTINNASGNFTLGNGLALNGNQLSATAQQGVISLQGQTGAVTLTDGGGISITGTTITNTGITSIGGVTGNINVGAGLSIGGGTLVNTGVATLTTSSQSLTITKDASNNYVISEVTSGVGGVVTLGPSTPQDDPSNNPSISINKTGSGNLIQLSTGVSAVNKFVVDSAGVITQGTIDASQVSGTLGVGSGGTGLQTAPTAGQLLIGNGTGYALNTLTGGSGISIDSTSTPGHITISAPSSGSCSSCASANLSNLASVAINTTLLPGAAGGVNLGSSTLPFGQLSLSGSSLSPSINNFLITGTSTHGTDTITLPDNTGTIAVAATGPLSLDSTTGILSCSTCLTGGGSGGTGGTAVTSLDGFTGPVTIQGSGGLSVGNVSGQITLSLPSNLVNTVNGGSGTIIIQGSGTNNTTSVLADSTTTPGTTYITISDATSTTKGLASFSSTDLTVTNGNVDTIQGISTTASPTFNSLSLTTALGVGNGGTGLNSVAQNGQILIGNGAGYTLNTLSAGSGVSITNTAGAISISVPSAGSCASCANQSLSDLAGVAINTSLTPASNGAIDLGSSTYAFRNGYLAGTMQIGLQGTPTGQLYVSGKVPTSVLGTVNLSSGPTSTAISGSYAYVTSAYGNNLQVIDISNPSSPAIVGSVATGNFPVSVAVSGHYAYIVNLNSNTLQVIDISDPTSPVMVATIATGTSPRSIAVSGRYAYVANFTSNSLQVIDISNPIYPNVVGSVAIGSNTRSIAVSGRYAYLANYGSNTMQVIDVSNPASPTVVGTVTTQTNPDSVAVSGRYAYVVNYGSNSLQVIDISNPTNPYVKSSVNSDGANPNTVIVSGNNAYVLNYNSFLLSTFNISNPTNPIYLGSFSAIYYPSSLAVSGRYAYATGTYFNQLQTFDLGGTYSQNLQAGSTETGSLQVDNTALISGSADIAGGATIGQSLAVSGDVGVNGNLQVNFGGSPTFSVSSNNVNVGTGQMYGSVYNTKTNISQVSGSYGAAMTSLNTTNGNYIYILGGGDNTISYGQQNSDGSIISWTTSPALPVSLYGAMVTIDPNYGYIYVVGGYTSMASGTNAQAAIYYAPINLTTGFIGSWTTAAKGLITGVGLGGAYASNGVLTVFGGATQTSGAGCSVYGSFCLAPTAGTEVSTVQYTKLTTGAPGSWNTTTPLPQPLANFTFSPYWQFGVGSYIYINGGVNSTNTSVGSNYSTLRNVTDGTVGAWTINNGSVTNSTPGGTVYCSTGLNSGQCTGSPIFFSTNSSLGVAYTTSNPPNGGWITTGAPALLPSSMTAIGGYLYGLSTWSFNSPNIMSLGYGSISTSTTSLSVSNTIISASMVTGTAAVKSLSNTTSAFQVQNASGADTLSVDTLNNRVNVGATGTPTGQLYISGTVPTGATGSVTTGSQPYSVAVSGSYSYVVNHASNTLQVIDISNPSNPTVVGSVGTSSTPNSVAVSGQYAYVGEASALQVIDISNPSNPTVIGSLGIGFPIARSISISGRYLFGLGAAAMRVVDISNPSNPVLIKNVTVSGSPDALTVYGRYAYVVGGSSPGYLQIIDISNPTNPTVVSTLSVGGFNYSVTVSGRYAYVVGSYFSNALIVIDISNPTNPTQVGSTSINSYPYSVALSGSFAYVVNTSGTVQVIDISNPTSPTAIGQSTAISSSSDLYGIAISGRYAYVVDYGLNALRVFDLGGAYSQSLQAGSTQTGSLMVGTNASVTGDASIQGGLSVGRSLQVSGDFANSGSALFQNTTNSAVALQVKTTSGLSTFNIDNTNQNVGISGLSNMGPLTISTATTGGTLPLSTTYYYEVTALNSTGESLASPEASITTGSSTSTNANTITWAAVTGATSYRVYRGTAAGGENTYYTTATTSYTDTATTGGTSATPPTINSSYADRISASGSVFQTTTNSANGFQVQNAAANTDFNVNTSTNTVTVQGGASQSADILDVSQTGGIVALKVTSTGTVSVTTGSTTAFSVTNGSTTTVLNVDSTNLKVQLASGANLEFLGTGNTTNAITKKFICTVACAAGDVVTIDTANPGQVTELGTANSALVAGVVVTGASAGGTAEVAISGVVQANMATAPAVNTGDLLITSGTAGLGEDATVNSVTPATGAVFGKAMSAKAATTSGQVWVLLKSG